MSGEQVPVTDGEEEAFRELAAALERRRTTVQRWQAVDDRGVWAFYE